MADNINNTGGGGGNTGLAFIVGAIVVVLAVIAYFVFARGGAPETKQVDVDVDLPEVSAPAALATSVMVVRGVMLSPYRSDNVIDIV